MATEDGALLALWEEWKVALHESLEATSEDVGKAAHARSVEIEKRICETPAEGLHGIAVQLALWHFNSEPDESDYADAAALADLIILRVHQPESHVSPRTFRCRTFSVHQKKASVEADALRQSFPNLVRNAILDEGVFGLV